MRVKYIDHLRSNWKSFENTLKITTTGILPHLAASESKALLLETPHLAAYAPHPEFDHRPWHYTLYFHLSPYTASIKHNNVLSFIPSRLLTPTPSPPTVTTENSSYTSSSYASAISSPPPLNSNDDRSLSAFDTFQSHLPTHTQLPPTSLQRASASSKRKIPHDSSSRATGASQIDSNDDNKNSETDDEDWETKYNSDMADSNDEDKNTDDDDSHTTFNEIVPMNISHPSSEHSALNGHQPTPPPDSQDFLSESPDTNLLLATLLDNCPIDKQTTLKTLFHTQTLPILDLQSLVTKWKQEAQLTDHAAD
eukprot:scaffold88435_cov40-Attheya_sp.AAC.2